METANGNNNHGARVDTTAVFLDVFGDRTEFATFDEFSELFVRFEKKSRYIFRVKNSSSVEAENRRRKDKIDAAIKYSGLVLCCVNCGDASKTLKRVQEGDTRQLCDAHIYLRYRSSSRKLAIISSSFVHNHQSQAGNGCFHRKQSVTERIGKPRDGRRKFVRAGDRMGKLTRPILPAPAFEHLVKGSNELTIIPLGAGGLGGHPDLPPPLMLHNHHAEDHALCPQAHPALLSPAQLLLPPGLRSPDNSLMLFPRGPMKMDVPVMDGFCRDVKRLREDATGMGTLKESFHVQEKSGEISVCFRIPPYGYKADMGRIFEPECILQCYEDEHHGNSTAKMEEEEEEEEDERADSEEAECMATDLSIRSRGNDDRMESDFKTPPATVATTPPAEAPENLSLAAMRAVANASRQYTVTWKELEPLFRFCSRCGAPVEKTRHSLHSVLSVSAVCQRGHGVFWTSRS
uniref:ZSWIM3 N-terminal domain-containing protein n=1 Tax=Rhipicephalus appendiculatus TaxID=34631 RepID=A0A131YH82_RHIAP